MLCLHNPNIFLSTGMLGFVRQVFLNTSNVTFCVGKTDFSAQLKRLLLASKKVGCNMDILRQTACMVVNYG